MALSLSAWTLYSCSSGIPYNVVDLTSRPGGGSGSSSESAGDDWISRCEHILRENDRVLQAAMNNLIKKLGDEPLGCPIPTCCNDSHKDQIKQNRKQRSEILLNEFEDRQMSLGWKTCENCLTTHLTDGSMKDVLAWECRNCTNSRTT